MKGFSIAVRSLVILALLTICGSSAFAQYTNPFEGQSVRQWDFQNAAPSTPPIAKTMIFSGAGLNNVTPGGSYNGSATAYYTVIIDGIGSPNTFKWKKNAGGFTTGVAITGSAQTLSDNVTVTFGTTTGYTLDDQWVVTITPTANVYLDNNGTLTSMDPWGGSKVYSTIADFASPPSAGYGSSTPRPVAATTITASGQITSTVTTGTAPFVVASTTNVANLNASSLSGATFASPGAIGSGTPSTGLFTTVTGQHVHRLGTPLTLGVGATTIALPAGSGSMVVTGDGGGNTIATITGGTAGLVYILSFVDTNVTISDASNLKLNGNFVSTADDILVLFCKDGTVFQEVSRSAN
jgi:hypothetical protein